MELQELDSLLGWNSNTQMWVRSLNEGISTYSVQERAPVTCQGWEEQSIDEWNQEMSQLLFN